MGRGLSTIVLIVILAGLGAYIYFVDANRPGGVPGPAGTIAESKEKVFTVEADKIEELRVTADKETTLLRKVNGTWQMVEPTQTEADQTEVSGLSSSITGLEFGRIVEDNATDLANYGLADPRLKVAFKGQDGATGEIHIGERTATQNDLYAVKAGEKRVFLIPSYHDTSFNKKPFDLRDKRVVLVKRDEVNSLEISGDAVLQVARTGSEWRLNQPVQARAEYSAIEGLITRVATANMTKLIEQAPAGGLAGDVLSKYGLDKPVLTVTVGAGSTKAAIAIGKEENGAVYARDLSRPMVFTIDPAIVTDLKKSADEYRNKNVFEFRSFTLARLRITRGPNTYEFQKAAATGDNAGDKWQRTINGGAAAEVEAAKVEDLLSKLTNLRIESFVPNAPAPSELTVSASYDDDGKFERVRFGKAGADVIAAREGEPGGGRIDAANYEETIKALDAVVTPAT